MRGWHGNSYGHSLARRGFRLYAKKDRMTEPIFYARKREEEIPQFRVLQMAKSGMTFKEMQEAHPDADVEELRQRGIRAIDTVNGADTLSRIDRSGVDELVKYAQNSLMMKDRVKEAITDRQQSSFIQKPKVEALRERLK
jgi:NADPH-dependent glutamate synthase beta subunit-like oxidoreductase